MQVGFRISVDLLEALSSWNEESEEQHKSWQIEMHGKERRVQFNDELIVEFNNKSEQVYICSLFLYLNHACQLPNTLYHSAFKNLQKA